MGQAEQFVTKLKCPPDMLIRNQVATKRKKKNQNLNNMSQIIDKDTQ